MVLANTVDIASSCERNSVWVADDITLSRSKTDQNGQGITKAIPYGAPEGICCPATAMKEWLFAAKITSGSIFRRITREGIVGPNPLYAGSINAILKTCAAKARLVYIPDLSGHSFRRGLATSAYRAGADFKDIKRQGGWHHDSTVQGYIDEAGQFDELKRKAVSYRPSDQ